MNARAQLEANKRENRRNGVSTLETRHPDDQASLASYLGVHKTAMAGILGKVSEPLPQDGLDQTSVFVDAITEILGIDPPYENDDEIAQVIRALDPLERSAALEFFRDPELKKNLGEYLRRRRPSTK